MRASVERIVISGGVTGDRFWCSIGRGIRPTASLRVFIFTTDCRAAMEVTHLTLPDNQAALAPFPPGCPVLVSGSSGDSEPSTTTSPQTYLGQIHSVYIDLGSTSRNNFYRVRPSSAASATEAATELRSVAESALTYAPGCSVTVNASALPPFVTEGGGGDTRDATILSCVGGGGSNSYYLLEVMPGPSDSWANIQSTVPVDSVRYRVPTKDSSALARAPEPAPAPAAQEPPPAAANDNEDNNNDDQGARVISPHPHTIPADEDGSSLNSSSRAPPVPSITINTDRKRSAEQLDCDGGSSTLSPMPTDGSISVASSNAIAEEVVRRIDIPETVDANKIKGALVGPGGKINGRMQTKFGVIISILGLDDAVSSSVVDSFSKLGPISFTAGDKCIMIQGSERKVHDAAKVVIHMLVNKCYDGNDKNALTRELRVVRQVRKKAELSPRSESARADLPSPTKKLKTGPAATGFHAAQGSEQAQHPAQRASEEEAQHSGSVEVVSESHLAHNNRGDAISRPPMATPYGRDQWRVVLWAPLDEYPTADFVGSVVGHRGSTHRKLEAKYNVRISIRCEKSGSKTGNKLEPLHAIIIGSCNQTVNDAANQVAEKWNGETANLRPAPCPTLPSACRQLLGESSYDGQHWNIDVKSPLDPYWSLAGNALGNTETFKCIIGEGGCKKKTFLAMFKGESFFCLRGGGIHDQNGKPTDGPLRVHIKGPDLAVVENAAAHISRVLVDEMAGNGSLSQSESYYGPAGANRARQARSVTSPPTSEGDAAPLAAAAKDPVKRGWSPPIEDDSSPDVSDQNISRDSRGETEPPNPLFMGMPRFDGKNWGIDVRSPIDQNALFGRIIGKESSRKRELIDMFGGKVFFCLRGEGVRKKDGMTGEADISGPLRVFIQGPDSEIVQSAAEYVAGLLDRKPPKATTDGPPSGSALLYSQHQATLSDLPAGPMCLVSDPVWVGGHRATYWQVVVKSPISERSLFGCLVGEGGENKKMLERKFSDAFFNIRGEGVPLRNGGQSEGPLRVEVEGNNKENLLTAARHVAEILLSDLHSTNNDQFRSTGLDGVTAQPTSETRALLSGNPLYDDQSSTWFLDVFSPLDQCSTFGVLIGEGGKEKQKLIQMFDRRVFFCLRGDGLQSNNAAGDSSGPLRVFVQGPAPDIVIFAAEHIAGILLEQKRAEDSSMPRNSSYRADFFGHYGDTNIEYGRDRQRTHPPQSGSLEVSMKLLGKPFHTGMRWAMMVHSPLDEQPLFNVIVGGGGVNKKKLTRAFPNVFFTIAGRGVRSNVSVRMTHCKSDDPLHVLVEAADKEVLLVASKHVATIVSDAAAAAAQSSHRYY